MIKDLIVSLSMQNHQDRTTLEIIKVGDLFRTTKMCFYARNLKYQETSQDAMHPSTSIAFYNMNSVNKLLLRVDIAP